jgi:threonine dehydrogenase-like Zn-dependent dehydrogenase
MVVNTADELKSEIHREWPDGVDACIDTVGLGDRALECVRDGGSFVTSVPSAVPGAGPSSLRPCRCSLTPPRRQHWRVQVAAGELTVRVAAVLPLERFRDGYARLGSGGSYGKIVLIPRRTACYREIAGNA